KSDLANAVFQRPMARPCGSSPTGHRTGGMDYISTRGQAPRLGLADALLTGLARDGGLYLPESWPQFGAEEIRAMRGLSYAGLATRLLTPFVEKDIPAPIFERIVREAYATFHHEAVCPIVQTGQDE